MKVTSLWEISMIWIRFENEKGCKLVSSNDKIIDIDLSLDEAKELAKKLKEEIEYYEKAEEQYEGYLSKDKGVDP